MRRDGASAAETGAPRHLVLFDGQCALCDGTVRALLRLDRRRRLTFAPLQGEAGRRLSAHLGLDAELRSIVFLRDAGDPAAETVFTRSRAVLAILEVMGGAWSLAAALGRLLPVRVADACYDAVAARRRRWFGAVERCRLPPPGESGRFLP